MAPGLTNLLVKRAADLLDEVESVHIRLYESSQSEDPISQWSPEVSFDEAVSHPRIYRNRKFQLSKRFSEAEKFHAVIRAAGLEGKILHRGKKLHFFIEVQLLQQGVSVEIESWMFQPVHGGTSARV